MPQILEDYVGGIVQIDNCISMQHSAVSPEQFTIKKDAWEKMTADAKEIAKTIIHRYPRYMSFVVANHIYYCKVRTGASPKVFPDKKPYHKRYNSVDVIIYYFIKKWQKPRWYVKCRIAELISFCSII